MSGLGVVRVNGRLAKRQLRIKKLCNIVGVTESPGPVDNDQDHKGLPDLLWLQSSVINQHTPRFICGSVKFYNHTIFYLRARSQVYHY